MLSHAGVERAGILRNPTVDWPPVWLTSFGVADPAAAAARAEALGGKVLLRPSPEVREGTMAIVADPSGALVVLQQVKS
jgi:predicted enzyme related to lactoylglutathione lyase